MPLPLRYAFRKLAKSPQFTALAVLMLGFGVALSTTAFGIANSLMLRALPFDRPEQLVRIFTANANQGARQPLAPANALDVQAALSDIGEFTLFQQGSNNVADPGQPAEQQAGLSVEANALHMLGIQPLIGRGFVPDDSKAGHPMVVMLTHLAWIERYGGDPNVLGKTVRIENDNRTIVGVLPPRFDEPLVWHGCKYVDAMIIWPDWHQKRVGQWMNAMGRLKPGVTLEQAQVRLDAMAAKFKHDYPREFGMDKLRIVPLGTSYIGPQGRAIYWMVVALAALVLVIACANLGGVQLARALSRGGELAIRSALGATRRDLILAVAAESVVLGVVGTVAGVLLAIWSRQWVQHRLINVSLPIDARVLLFAAACGTVAIIISGVVPAWWVTRATMAETMKETGRNSTGDRAQHALKYTLIVGQLGLALVLVSTALTLVLGVRTFLGRERGWQPEGLVSAVMHAPYGSLVKDRAEPRLAQMTAEKVAAIPGVESVAIAASAPVYGGYPELPLLPEGMELPAPGRETQGAVMAVNAAFFHTLGIPLREGRLFPAKWRRTDPQVTVVSENTARHFWPAGDALGKRIRFGRDEPWHEVIGVVGDVNFETGFGGRMNALQAYEPVEEMPLQWYNVVVKTSIAPAVFERSLRVALAEIDSDVVARDIGSLPQMLESFASNRPLVMILVTFASAGLVIAIVGLYGVISQFTHQRRREIGIRLALGATYERVLAMMLAHGSRLLVFGVVAGTAGASGATVLLRQGMPTVPALSWPVQILIGLALAAAGLAACLYPAHRAARLNPVEVLRAE